MRASATTSPRHRDPLRLPRLRGTARAVAPHGGRPPKYREDAEHNAQTAFVARREERDDASPDDVLPRPSSDAGYRLRIAVERMHTLLGDHQGLLSDALAALTTVGDPSAVEAELAAVRAEAQQRVSHAETQLAEEQRDRVAAEQRAEAAEADRDAVLADRDEARDTAEQARQ